MRKTSRLTTNAPDPASEFEVDIEIVSPLPSQIVLFLICNRRLLDFMKSGDKFYAEMHAYSEPVTKLLADRNEFRHVPDDWYVVITDIRDSTKAVREGKHNQVNLVATGSIIATLNIARKFSIEVPFFFGGDGATMLIPSTLLDPVVLALTEHKRNTIANFGMDLRLGYVPVSEIYNAGYQLLVAKIKLNNVFSIPVLIGRGLTFAEKKIKGPDFDLKLPPIDESTLDMEGMECRWDWIKPPQKEFEVVSLLVDAREEQEHSKIFTLVLEAIEDAYGPLKRRIPISKKKLVLDGSIDKIRTEMTARLGRSDWMYLLKNWLVTWIGKVAFKVAPNNHYLTNLIELTDTLTIDGRVNTVISGLEAQRIMLTKALTKMEHEGLIYYGLHVSPASIMSCYVRDRQDHHIHFVDGSGGGYTNAAVMLKGKFQ